MKFKTIIFNSEKHAVFYMTENAEFKTLRQQMQNLESHILYRLTLGTIKSTALFYTC